MPRKTDSNNPGDWLAIAESELEAVRVLTAQKISYDMCRGKLAEILEKGLKAELIRSGWFLEKTHDLERLRKAAHAGCGIGWRAPAAVYQPGGRPVMMVAVNPGFSIGRFFQHMEETQRAMGTKVLGRCGIVR